jgi:hypothetical protein
VVRVRQRHAAQRRAGSGHDDVRACAVRGARQLAWVFSAEGAAACE